MSRSQYAQLEDQMVQQEVHRILTEPADVTQKVQELNVLYNGSAMTNQEHDDALRRIGY